jgi:hypothetical protein
MSRSGALETKRAKLMVAVVALVLLAAFQVALQAKPAQAWEMRVTITGAGTVEETTPADLLNCSTSPTNPTGLTGATCLAGTPSGAYNHGWDVDYLATPASGYTFQRWESDGSARSPIICDRSDPPATAATYSGSTACKFRATGNLQTRVVFADTSRPATPTINSTNPSSTTVNGSKSFNFSLTSDPTFKQFECRVTPTVQTTFQPCASGVSFNPTADGNYTFAVQAVDWSGNVSLSSASHSWTVDKTPPFANITSAPSSFSNDPTPTFDFSSTDSTATFQCNLTGPGINTGFSSCVSGKTYSALSDGSHTFSVKATDAVGNTSTSSRTWTIDTVLPETTLNSSVGPGEGSTTQGNDPVFEFTSNEAGATFECNLTGPDLTGDTFTACPSPKSYSNLKDGTYTFKVRAKDRATNVDGSPAERTWTINSPPTVLAESLIPAKAATGVSRTTDVGASFSEEMAPTSIANLTTHVSKTFKLQMYNAKKRKWIAVPATVDVTNDNTTAILDPYGATEGSTERALAGRKKFKATITTGVTDAQGNPIAKNFVWTFNTGSV